LLLAASLLGCSTAPRPAGETADPRIGWLQKNAIPFRSISPADRDFSDLQPLKKILRNRRIVLLGEQSHGDGTTFLAKARLIEFLHEEMGFDVLAFESGLYNCWRANQALRSGEDPVKAVRSGVFAIWTLSEQVKPLMEYLGATSRTGRPLELAGFDSQFTGSASGNHLVSDLTAYLKGLGSGAAGEADWPAFTEKLQALTQGSWEAGEMPVPPAPEQEAFLDRIEKLQSEIATSVRPDSEAPFWLQLLESTAAYARMEWEPDPGSEAGNLRVRQLRDSQMGRNLIWLANERYPGRKIIVWAATYHAARNLDRIDPGSPELARFYQAVEPMGEVAWKILGDQMYTLGFTAYEGQVGNVFRTHPPEPLDKPTAGSLEDLLFQAGLENALVDFRNPPRGGDWLRQPLISRPLGYTEMKGDWTQVLDGMMFTRVMEPSKRAGGIPQP
jgi:erythromycin esterase